MTTTRTAKTSHKEQLLHQGMELIYAEGTFVIALSSGDERSLKSSWTPSTKASHRDSASVGYGAASANRWSAAREDPLVNRFQGLSERPTRNG